MSTPAYEDLLAAREREREYDGAPLVEPPDEAEDSTAWPPASEPGSPEAAGVVERRQAAARGEGARVLALVEDFLARFVVYPTEHARVAHTLWVAHAHLMEAWDSTPRIAFLSPEPGSGKSRALEVTEPLVPRPVHAVNTTPAYLFRKVSDEAGPPTILYDEIDTVFGPRAKESEDIRGMLNAGHRKGAMAGRCVVRGKVVETEELPAYCAVALAGLDDLPDTLMTRSVVVRMRRRTPNEPVEPWRMRVNGPEAVELGDRLARWAAGAADRLAWPDMPDGIEDRNADVWEALLAVADLAGEDWPTRARVAAVALVTHASDRAPSLGVLLLRDLRAVFTEAVVDRMPTADLLERLVAIEESPWGDLRGKPLDARGLARRLDKYGVRPKVIRVGEETARGYETADLHEPWAAYLPTPVGAQGHVTPVTGVTPPAGPQPAVTAVTDVTHPPGANGQNHPCRVCGQQMADLGDGATTHPTCEQPSATA